jgi:gamma-glutamyltranspeptidase/glutathione hydrolase
VYAATGFPASSLLALGVRQLAGIAGTDELTSGPGGEPLRAGDLVRRPGHARVLEAIVSNGRSGVYQGELGDELLTMGRGQFTPADLSDPNAEWVEPLGLRVWDHDVWTIPSNSQGYLTLLGAGIAEGLDLPDDPDDPVWAHLLVESARAAGHDRPNVLFDGADLRPLLQPDAMAERRGRISPDRAGDFPLPPLVGGTTYLCAVDADRMGVSLIQSNASGFGSHVFLPGLGIGLQNRGIGFSLQPGHPAELAPGRRPPHTLSPALVTRPDGSLRTVIGTMGGDSQPQILLQLLDRTLRLGQGPGPAVAAARWTVRNTEGTGFDTWTSGAVPVTVEDGAPPEWADGLRARGHEVVEAPYGRAFGHAHMIEVTRSGLAGAADPRTLIGEAAGY